MNCAPSSLAAFIVGIVCGVVASFVLFGKVFDAYMKHIFGKRSVQGKLFAFLIVATSIAESAEIEECIPEGAVDTEDVPTSSYNVPAKLWKEFESASAEINALLKTELKAINPVDIL